MESFRNLLAALPAQAGDELDPAAAAALAWTLAAGPTLARRARCLGLHQGTLRLALEGPDTAETRRQLESVAPELRQALNRILGAGRVQRLAFA